MNKFHGKILKYMLDNHFISDINKINGYENVSNNLNMYFSCNDRHL